MSAGGETAGDRRAHSNRFRKVSNRYPRRVAEAYEGDLRRAMADSDERVAATVAAWERDQGFRVVDWSSVDAKLERGDLPGRHVRPAAATEIEHIGPEVRRQLDRLIDKQVDDFRADLDEDA